MRKGIDFFLVVFLVMACASCNKPNATPAEYAKTLKDNKELNKTITIGQVDYRFRILTPEVMALRSATDANKQVDAVKYAARLKELQGTFFVNIEMQLHDQSVPILKYKLGSEGEYEQRVMYYEFYAKNDVKLSCNGAQIPPSGYQYENHLGLMPYNTLVLAFPSCSNGKEVQVMFSDKALSNLFIKVNFNLEAIDRLPKLILK